MSVFFALLDLNPSKMCSMQKNEFINIKYKEFKKLSWGSDYSSMPCFLKVFQLI